jgi:hypothetical protein
MVTKHVQELTQEEKSLLDFALTDLYYNAVKQNTEDSPIHKQYDTLMKKLKGLL